MKHTEVTNDGNMVLFINLFYHIYLDAWAYSFVLFRAKSYGNGNRIKR